MSKLGGWIFLGLLTLVALAFTTQYGGFERRVIEANGVVIQKTYHPSMAYHAVKIPTRVTMREGFVLVIRVDGVSKPMQINLDIGAGAPYDVGRRVRVWYEEGGIPVIFRRYHINQINYL